MECFPNFFCGVMKILAISGSLRAASINSALLRTAARLAPPEVEITLCSVIGVLPLFNPDLELHVPSSVMRLREEVAAADALLIASPEYAHGVTGTIKNMLDWLVSFELFCDKPVALLNASPRAHHADFAMREILKTMSAVIVEDASVTIPLIGANMTEESMVSSPLISQAIRDSLAALYGDVVLKRYAGRGIIPPVISGV
jgi:chromate reductase, NAD(P)H dehydrogenase (quinone)